jgi:hypothetical protein
MLTRQIQSARQSSARRRRLSHWLTALLMAPGSVALGPAIDESRALAQEASGLPSPPADSPVLGVGQRILRPWGPVEITTFRRTQKDQDTEFVLAFLIRNEGTGDVFFPIDHFRIIADGVPRAPSGSSRSEQFVRAEAAEEGWVTFRVPGHPQVVYLQWGIGGEGRSYLRWPE